MSRHVSVLFFSLAFVAAGCQPSNDKPSNLPPLFPLTVTVVQEGTPVDKAFVRLIPGDPKMPWNCGATTDDNGNAVIMTIGKFKGAPEGDYKVLISKTEMPPVHENDLSDLKKAPPSGPSESVDLIDLKYSQPNTTTLEVTVEKGSPTVEFDVGPAVRIVKKGPH